MFTEKNDYNKENSSPEIQSRIKIDKQYPEDVMKEKEER